MLLAYVCFFFQAEDGIRDIGVTGVQTCALPIFINTGWNKLWAKDNARYVKSCPGIGVKAAEWLIAKDPMLLGSDNWPVEVSPNPDPQLSLPVHQIALVVNGVHLLENLKLDDLAARQVYEFAFVMQPLKIQGGTGSTVAPIAIR